MKTQNAAVKTAFAAAGAARDAAQAAGAAANLLASEPTAWAFADQAYWLCKAAAQAARNAADALDQTSVWRLAAQTDAYAAADEAQAAADDLVSLAEAADHTIRR